MPRQTLRAAGAILLGGVAGCDSPQAWTDYMSPTYGVLDEQTLTQPTNIAIELNGSFGGMPADKSRVLVREAMHAPSTPDSGSVRPDRRAVWTLSGGNAGEAAVARAEYYRGGTLMSSAEGRATLPSGSQGETLRVLLDDVAGQLFPPIRHRGGGRG
jgi:hypothetical protein